MFVPENKTQRHAVAMFLATAGAAGPLLGSDEREVIYLVFGVFDLQSKEIIGIKQYLVRPLGLHYAKTPNTSATSSESGSTSSAVVEPLIPEAVLNSSGRSLLDTINDFDTYLHSLRVDHDNLCFITDGQLPLRQCLHPEVVAKEIQLPSYYWKFSDLKKEFSQFKSLSGASTPPPFNDPSKLQNPQQQSQLSQLSLADMLNDLELPPHQSNDFYIKEARDMVSIVQTMLKTGHNFESSEEVNLVLEPGICSIDDEIDGNCIVRARGLPWQSSDQDIAKFFRGLNITKGGVALCLSPQGRRNGEALIRFISQEHRDMALKRHKHHIGSRYIEVYRASGEDFLAVAGGASNEAQTFLSKGAQVIIRMRGLPYDCTAAQVLDFFANGDNSCKVLDDSEGILFVKKPDGRSTGDAFVLFSDESEAPKALSKHRESIGQRYIELFRSTIAEVQQVLNRSMDPKTYEQNAPKPPLIAQIPPAISQMPMLPQHVITSGTEKNCIRLRGLPYEAKVEHILHFLEDFAKNIVYQGVHLVYNSQGQFNGEAFIQMDSEQAAQASAQQKHHKHMLFGKKQRYIEVFQCSGASLIAPQHVNFPPPLSHYGASTPSPMFPSPPQFVYWGYSSGPLSPTSAYIGPLQLQPHGFAHSSPLDRTNLLTVGDASQISQMDDGGGMKTPEVHRITSPHIEFPPNSALNVSPKFNFHNEEVFYYQSQDNFITEKVLLLKNSPVAPQMCGYAAKQQNIVDLNNNQQISSVIELSLPSPVHCQDRMLPPLISPHFQSPQHVAQMNWSL